MKKYKLGLISFIAAGVIACSVNPPVKVVSGDKNVDYSAPTTIHISETQSKPVIPHKKEIHKPANATALCFNGSYSTDTQNPCANEGGVQQRFSHYSAK